MTRGSGLELHNGDKDIGMGRINDHKFAKAIGFDHVVNRISADQFTREPLMSEIQFSSSG